MVKQMQRFLLIAVAISLVLVPPAAAWTWPADREVLKPFAFDPTHPYAAGQHRGIDIAGSTGADVRAPAAGTVTFAGSVPSSGKSVTIQTQDGYSVTLVHLGSISAVRGTIVAEGAPVGSIGASGDVEWPQPYVHLGIRIAAEAQGYLDPLSFLPPRVPPPQIVVTGTDAPTMAPAPATVPPLIVDSATAPVGGSAETAGANEITASTDAVEVVAAAPDVVEVAEGAVVAAGGSAAVADTSGGDTFAETSTEHATASNAQPPSDAATDVSAPAPAQEASAAASAVGVSTAAVGLKPEATAGAQAAPAPTTVSAPQENRAAGPVEDAAGISASAQETIAAQPDSPTPSAAEPTPASGEASADSAAPDVAVAASPAVEAAPPSSPTTPSTSATDTAAAGEADGATVAPVQPMTREQEAATASPPPSSAADRSGAQQGQAPQEDRAPTAEAGRHPGRSVDVADGAPATPKVESIAPAAGTAVRRQLEDQRAAASLRRVPVDGRPALWTQKAPSAAPGRHAGQVLRLESGVVPAAHPTDAANPRSPNGITRLRAGDPDATGAVPKDGATTAFPFAPVLAGAVLAFLALLGGGSLRARRRSDPAPCHDPRPAASAAEADAADDLEPVVWRSSQPLRWRNVPHVAPRADSRRRCVAVRRWAPAHRPCGGLWRTVRRLRPLPQVARERRPHGLGNGRARDARHGDRRSRRAVAS